MTRNYLDILAETIRKNWDQPALTDFYLNEEGTAQDFTRGRRYTYGEMYQEIVRVADLLIGLGLQKGDHIAICGANSAHWVIAYLAIAKMQGVSVTVLNSLMPEDMAHQIDFSDAKALFTDAVLWMELSPFFQEGDRGRLSNVIGLDDWHILHANTFESRQSTDGQPTVKANVTATPNQERALVSFHSFAPDTLAMICFTSGSTGKPKGVMLPYRSISANIACRLDILTKQYKGERTVAILPFSHVYSTVIEILRPLCIGMSVYVYRSLLSIPVFLKGMRHIAPSYMVVVPKILEGLLLKSGDNINIYNYIIQSLGGSIKEILVGGARLQQEVEKALYDAHIPLANGYGATECGPGICVAFQDTYKCGTVGKAMPTICLNIAPSGEILVKGDNVMLGYYKDPEATAAKIDKDGWLHTGDKGHLDEDGYLYVEGRLNQDIIVLPNGENINPEDIEAKINALPEVKESIVLERDGHLVAIVVPQITNEQSPITNPDLRRSILRAVNPQLPLFCQLYDLELTDQPLARTEKQTLKRYLYK